MYKTIERGALNSSTYRLYYKNNGGPISPIHDIPLYVNAGEYVFNMVVEIPRWTNAKMEISLDEPLNPIKQDMKEGKLRYVPNCFPHHGIPWNYGALPQTLEDPNNVDEFTHLKGDGDPVDVIEIGQRVPSCGEILPVKVLGALALIDRNKIDWKLIALSADDEMWSLLKEMKDVDVNLPNIVNATKEWFQIYNCVVGKPENKFYFNGEVQGQDTAHQIIKSAHNAWQNLINHSSTSGISCYNVTHFRSPCNVSISDAEVILNSSPSLERPHSRDPLVDLWHFVNQK